MKEYGHNGFWNVWIRAWSCEPSQKDDRTHEKCISCFENWGFGVSLVMSHWSWYWVRTYLGTSSQCPPHGASRSKVGMPLFHSFLFTPTAVLAAAPALSKLDLFREPLSVAAHTAGEHVRELESSGAVSCLKTKPVYVENAPSQVIYAGESTSTPTDMRQLPRKGGKNEWKYEQA